MDQEKVVGRPIVVTVLSGLLLIGGFIVRANADDWSVVQVRVDANTNTFANRKSLGMRSFLDDLGAVSLALGTLGLAAVGQRWLADETQGK